MTETEAIRLFKCLADKSRLQILKSLALEDMYVERLAERLGISAPTVSFHLKKLADAGAVTSYKSQYYMMYSLNKDVFETSMLEIIREKSDEAEIQAQRDAEYRKKVIDAFFEYGKLKSIPSQRKKERIVLEVIADAFEYDRTYTEREVNVIIADFFDDFCTIRRDMVAENLLNRDSGMLFGGEEDRYLHQTASRANLRRGCCFRRRNAPRPSAEQPGKLQHWERRETSVPQVLFQEFPQVRVR